MNNQPIGILDSGVGGLSVWKEVVKKLPYESTIYLADSKNCPYGVKSKKEIYRLSKRLIEFLLGQKVKLVVIACNTITVTCLNKLRNDFPQIPIIGIVPVVKTAAKKTKNGRIGILSTTQTAKSKYQKDLIKKFCKGLKVLNLGTDKLVSLIETDDAEVISKNFRVHREGKLGLNNLKSEGARLHSENFVAFPSHLTFNKILKREIKPFIEFKIDVLALGCSHFPFLRKAIQRILGKKVKILDSGGAVARQVERVLKNNSSFSLSKKPSFLFYTTGDIKQFKTVSAQILGKKYIEVIKSAKDIFL